MKRLVVKACGRSPLEDIRSSIEARLPYAQFHESYRSFRTLTFDIPDENIDQVKWDVNQCGHKCFWDRTYKLDPVEKSNQSVELDSADLTAIDNTKFAAGSGTGTVYVRVNQLSGANVYEFSNTGTGGWFVPTNYAGIPAGTTLTFDQGDPTNAGHPFRLSETQDGTHGGGVEYTQGVTVLGNAPGTAASGITVTFGASTASRLFFYCTAHPGMGRNTISPQRYGAICMSYDTWHLDRISKRERSAMNSQFSYTHTGDNVDIYVIDSGVRGASRPTGAGAALHPELFHPDNRTNLDGASEQGDYRVYQLPHYAGAYGTNNEDDEGHGTECAIMASGYRYGVAKKARIYSLKAFDSSKSGTFSAILGAYQAVIDHNNSTHSNYKGDNRRAIINASFGAGTPSGGTPVIELNDVGTDFPANDLEAMDEIESIVCRSENIVIVRSAGNGFDSALDLFLGPMQAKFAAGARTAGPQDLRFNNVDFDQPKISVGATEYNDTYADFSNYGNSVDIVAPGVRVECPNYDWTTTTNYLDTWSSWYQNIGGTSFSAPIVTGILACWAESYNYNQSYSNVPTLAKDWINTPNPGHRKNGGRSSNYPIDEMDEREISADPFSTTSGSSHLVVKFQPVDASHFLGNVGKKAQLRTPVPVPTLVGNINITSVFEKNWYGIVAEDAVQNTVTIDLGGGNIFTSTNINVGGGGPFSLGIISGTHQETDGPHFGSVNLETRTDAQETATPPTGTPVGTGLPVDAGYFDPAAGTFTPSRLRGAIFPFVEKTYTWAQGQGTISQSPIAHNSNVNINLGYSSATTTSGGETLDVGPWTITGDSLIGTNLVFNTDTGYLGSSATSSYFGDTSFTVIVTDTSTGNAQTYSFTLTGSGVNNIRSFTGGIDQVLFGQPIMSEMEFGSYAGSDLDKYWKVNPAIDANWGNAFNVGNQHTNDLSMSNGTHAHGNISFAFTSALATTQNVHFKVGNQHTSHWTDVTPPPVVNWVPEQADTAIDMTVQSTHFKWQGLDDKVWNDPRNWPSFPNQTLIYDPIKFVSPGRPPAFVNYGQLYPRFFEEVDEITVPADTTAGALAVVDYFDFPNNVALQDTTPITTSRDFLKDKRPRVGQLFPRGNAYRPGER